MAVPFVVPLLLPFAKKLLSKALPDKPAKAINDIVGNIVGQDKDLQKALEQERKFILEYSRILPRICLIMREAGRPFVLIVYTLTFIGYYLVTGDPPHALIVNIAKWVALSYIGSRGVEKVVQILKG